MVVQWLPMGLVSWKRTTALGFGREGGDLVSTVHGQRLESRLRSRRAPGAYPSLSG